MLDLNVTLNIFELTFALVSAVLAGGLVTVSFLGRGFGS